MKSDKKSGGLTLHGNFACETNNIVYMIECKKDTCKQRYIGQSGQNFASRIAQHRGYIQNRKFNQPTGYHFNQPGHSVSDMSVTILEKVKYRDKLYRREREKYPINKFDTYKNGMNKQP